MGKRGAAVGFFSCRTIWQQKHFRRATSVATIELLAEESDLHEMPQSEHTEKKEKNKKKKKSGKKLAAKKKHGTAKKSCSY
jgi:hypothetical protein